MSRLAYATSCAAQASSEMCFFAIIMQWGLTALHHAALSGQVDSIRLLVQELHSDPDIGDLVSYIL